MNEINAAIHEKIFGFERIGSEVVFYRRSGANSGTLEAPRDFLVWRHHNQELQEFMRAQGYTPRLTRNPINFEQQIGETYTATFNRGGEFYEETQPDMNTAVCLAALRAYAGRLSKRSRSTSPEG